VLQCAAVWRSALQCVAVRCSVLQGVSWDYATVYQDVDQNPVWTRILCPEEKMLCAEGKLFTILFRMRHFLEKMFCLEENVVYSEESVLFRVRYFRDQTM